MRKVPVIPQAAPATHGSQAGGLFMLAWGLVASAAGLAMVTNFRGFADNAARQAEASSAGLRKVPPWKWQQPPDPAGQAKVMRLIAIPFVIVGLIMIIAGIISISRGRIASSGLSALPSPLRYVFIAFASAAVGWSWLSPRGLFRPAPGRGGWRLAIALLSSLGGLIGAVSMAMGQLTVGIVAWALGGLAALVLLLDNTPPGRMTEEGAKKPTGLGSGDGP
jgi:hypothetical protein